MRALGIWCALLLGGLLCGYLLYLARPRRALPLYVRVEEDAENIEWLITQLLRKAPRRHLLIIDHTHGENKQILTALARRYRIGFVSAAPPDAAVLCAQKGVTAERLLAQYRRAKSGEAARQTG